MTDHRGDRPRPLVGGAGTSGLDFGAVSGTDIASDGGTLATEEPALEAAEGHGAPGGEYDERRPASEEAYGTDPESDRDMTAEGRPSTEDHRK